MQCCSRATVAAGSYRIRIGGYNSWGRKLQLHQMAPRFVVAICLMIAASFQVHARLPSSKWPTAVAEPLWSRSACAGPCIYHQQADWWYEFVVHVAHGFTSVPRSRKACDVVMVTCCHVHELPCGPATWCAHGLQWLSQPMWDVVVQVLSLQPAAFGRPICATVTSPPCGRVTNP